MMKSDIVAPMKTEWLQVRVTPDLKKKLQEHANKYGIAVSSVILIALAEYFDKDKK